MDDLSVGPSVRRSVCPVYCGKTADRIRMPFGIIGRTGPGMRQLVGFGDQSTVRGIFGGKYGAHHDPRGPTGHTCATAPRHGPLAKLLWADLLFLVITLCQLFVVHIKIICCCCVCFQCTVLCCKDCSVLIANIHDVFTVRVSQQTSGPLAIHVNPGGVVSELITVTSVSAVSLSGFPVLQDTWYPGYINHHFVIISD